MSSLPWNVALKFDRATKHVEELREACAAFLATEPYTYTRTVEGGNTPGGAGPVHVFRWEKFETPPRELGLIAGDAVHNARSALDHLAVHIDARGAALAGKTYTDEDEKQVQFLITTKPGEFNRRVKRNLPHADPDAIKVIEAFQPYNVSRNPELAQILMLSELDNLDKHRSLAPIGFSISYAVGRWPEAAFPAIQFARFADPNAISDYGEPGSEILRFTFPDEYRVEQIPCQLGYEVALFSVPGLRGLDAKVEQVITTARTYAEQIADRTLR